MKIASKTKLLIKRYFKYFLSVLIITFIVLKYEWKNVFNELLNLPHYIVFILIMITCSQLFINALIKSTMLKIFKFHLPMLQIYKRMFIGTYYGIIMPQTIGGDYYYIYYFGRKFHDYPRIFSGIFLIRVIGFTVFILLVLITLSFASGAVFKNSGINSLKLKNLIYVVVGIGAVFLWLLYFFRKFFKKAFIKIKEKFKCIQKDILNNYSSVISIFAFTLFFYVISVGGRVMLGKIIEIDLPIKELMLVIMIVNFLILLPISVGGIGIREGGYIALMGIMGINSTQALSLSILDFSIYLIAVLIGGVFSISSKDDIKFKENQI